MVVYSPAYLVVLEAMLLLSCLTTVYCGDEADKWDMLVFAQTIPRSLAAVKNKVRGLNFKLVPKRYWTIHGIWPITEESYMPTFCEPNTPFAFSKISSIASELSTWWSPYEENEHEKCFWQHQWSKHGTCTQGTFDQLGYFSQAIKWIKMYHMGPILQSCRIVPGSKYTVERINDCLDSLLPSKAVIVCYRNHWHKYVLLEIWICFDRSLQGITCKKQSNCYSRQLLYP